MGFIVGLITLVVFYIILKVLGFATKTILKFMINSIGGFLLLVIGNLIAESFGFGQVDITVFKVILATIFGIPGVLILFLFN